MDKTWSSLQQNKLNIFVQVNTSSEASKSGVSVDECVKTCLEIVETCPHLRLAGLMTIGIANDAACMKCLVDCRRQLAEALSCSEVDLELSMGMSNDFELAVELGATSVRVGSLIFGSRTPKPSTT